VTQTEAGLLKNPVRHGDLESVFERPDARGKHSGFLPNFVKYYRKTLSKIVYWQ